MGRFCTLFELSLAYNLLYKELAQIIVLFKKIAVLTDLNKNHLKGLESWISLNRGKPGGQGRNGAKINPFGNDLVFRATRQLEAKFTILLDHFV